MTRRFDDERGVSARRGRPPSAACARPVAALCVIFAAPFSLRGATDPIDLESAGPKNWAILALGGPTSVSITSGSRIGGAVPHVGVAATGNLQLTGYSSIAGKLFLNAVGQVQVDGQSVVTGSIVRNADAALNQAVLDARAASTRLAALSPTIINMSTISITNPGQNVTITGTSGLNVVRLTDLIIANGTLTLSAPPSGAFVVNVSGRFSLTGQSHIALAGGIAPLAVAYNVNGPGAVSLTGQATMTGILLTPHRSVDLAGSIVVTGEVIGGGATLSISGQGRVTNPYPAADSVSGAASNRSPSISLKPRTGQAGQSLSVTITGQFTNFVQGSTQASFGAGVSVGGAPEGALGPVTVTSDTTATAQIKMNATAAIGPRNIVMRTGGQRATLAGGFSVASDDEPGVPTITDFNPKAASIGTLVTLTGSNLQPNLGTSVQFVLMKQGGGTIAVGVSSSLPSSSSNVQILTFVVPAGAATGPITVTVNGKSVSTTIPLTIVPSDTFSLTAAPGSANLIRGQSTAYAVSLTNINGFNQLVALSVTGLPTGVTAAFQPQQIAGSQTSVLKLTAPASQPLGSATLAVSGSATVEGIVVVQSASVTLNVVPVTTSLLGRTVVTDALETPLTGVTVTMLGKDGNGNLTGCTGNTVSDAAGNFLLANLSAMCVGPQLVGFDGTTVTNPAGKYAGVNLIFTLVSGQVTASPILVHLPRIDTEETFLVQQNAAVDQNYSYRSIPGLAVTVYAHTTFTMPDNTQPNPFPLTAVQVPVDRLPDIKPLVPTMITAFIVAFQPANATTNQPVAVYYPNELNTPPGASMALLTLDPTHGQMVPYGTGTVSADGTQIIPDPDPAHPGHRYGLVHFDWHMPGYPPANQTNPCAFCPIAEKGAPVDLSSGLAVVHETDISFGGARGTISIVRNYRNGINPTATTFGPFGYGTNHNFSFELDTIAPASATVINLIMPDGNRFPFSKQSDGTFVNAGIPSMGGGVMRVIDSQTVDLRWKDGTTYRFIVLIDLRLFRTLLVSITDANGNITQIARNANGLQVSDIVDPVGRGLHFNYNDGGCITQITAPDGSFVSYDYGGGGSCGNAVQINAVADLRVVTHPDGSTTRYDYDNNHNLTAETDGRGFVVASNTYNSDGRVTRQRQTNGGVFQFSYTLQNPLVGILSPVLATAVTDPLGNQSVYRFSPNGALIGVTDALGQMRTIDRDGGNYVVGFKGNGVCAECGDTGAGDQSFSYDDSTGNLLSHTDGLGNTTTFAYDPVFNKVTSIKDPLGNTTTFTYDGHGNVLTQKDPNGNVTSYQPDQFGELTQVTDSLNQNTSFSYDSFGNLVFIKDPLGNITALQYDANGRLILAQDALGRRTSITYDRSNRITSQTNAQSGVTRFTYDQVGNLLSVTDPRNKTTSFTYDFMNRLANRTDALGRMDSRTYDLNENLIQFKDRRGQQSNFTYDVLDRLITEAYQDGGTVTRSYDSNSRLANVNDSASGVFTFSYDSAGRLLTSATPFGEVRYAHDARGAVTSRQVVGQDPVAYSYDPFGNLTSATLPRASANFAYDPRNQLSSINRLNGVATAFTYDQAARLLSLSHSKGTVIDAESYAYDAVGSRIARSTSIAQPLTTSAVPSAAYDADNEQTQFGSSTNTFDANGNLISTTSTVGSSNFTWDSRNQLKSIVTSGGQTTNFTYDFTGNLIAQADSGTSLNLTQSFVLDDLTNIAWVNRSDGDEYSVLAGQSIDQHLAVVHASGQIEYGLSDAINSTVATVDQTGSIKGRFLYEPFGQTSAVGSTYPFQYTGRVPVSGSFYYNRARFYNSQTGRFISEDPIGFVNGPNLYRYARNNPTGLTDPTGTQAGSALGRLIHGVITILEPLQELLLEATHGALEALETLAEVEERQPGTIQGFYCGLNELTSHRSRQFHYIQGCSTNPELCQQLLQDTTTQVSH